MCTDPARLDGGDGTLLPLVDFDYLTGVPKNGETAAPWSSQPDYYKVQCKRQSGAHWLDLSLVGLPGETRPDLGALVASGNNYHVPEVNLAEGNLLTIAQLQTDSYEKQIAKLERKLGSLKAKLGKQKQQSKALHHKARKLHKKLRKADSAGQKRAAKHKLERTRRQAKQTDKKIKTLHQRITSVKNKLG